MPDPLRKVIRGQKLAGRLSAQAWNKFIDAAKGKGQTGSEDIFDAVDPANTALFYWGGDPVQTLPAFSVLAYGDPIANASPATNPFVAAIRPTFASIDPVSSSEPFVITLKPIGGERVVRVAVAGLVPVQIEVVDESHTRACPISGTTDRLISSTSGVPIIWLDSTAGGTGADIRWAIILLGDPGVDSTSIDCSDIIGLIRESNCFALTIQSVEGSCDCTNFDTSQTATLTWDNGSLTSATLLYGCPPGVTTSECPDGGPLKFNIPVAGFTGSYTGWNQNYTITWSSGNTWTATKNGITVTAVANGSGGWNVTLTDGVDTVTYILAGFGADNCCDEFTVPRTDDGGTTGSPASLTMTPATSCGLGVGYTPILDKCADSCGVPRARLRWMPASGSGGRAITFASMGCGTDANGRPYIDFATDDSLLCTGTEGADCSPNKLVVRLTCQPCANEDWDGAGWYCVDGAGCQNLTSDPGTGSELWSGPFATEGECSCTVDISCCNDPLPARLCFRFTGADSPYDSLIGLAFQLHWVGVSDWQYVATNIYDPVQTIVVTPCSSGGINKYRVNVVFSSNCSLVNIDVDMDVPTCGLPVTGSGSTTSGTGCIGGQTIDFSIDTAVGGCDSNPPATTYNCVDGTCTEVYDDSGEYDYLEECQAACEGACGQIDCCVQDGDSATLHIPDGTYAGDYTSAWDVNGGIDWLATFAVPGIGTIYVHLSNFGSSFTQAEGDITTVDGGVQCNPLLLTFAGASFGATGDVTVD